MPACCDTYGNAVGANFDAGKANAGGELGCELEQTWIPTEGREAFEHVRRGIADEGDRVGLGEVNRKQDQTEEGTDAELYIQREGEEASRQSTSCPGVLRAAVCRVVLRHRRVE